MSSRSFLHRLLAAAYISLLLLLSGKLILLPVALIGPTEEGSSALLGAATYLPLAPGGRVLYCVDTLRTSCVLLEAGRAGVGKACYVELFEVPGWLWALAVCASVVLPLPFALARRRLSALAALALALLTLNLVAVGSLYLSVGELRVEIKAIELVRAGLNLVERVYEVELDLGVYKALSASCGLEGYGDVETELAGGIVRARIPREYFEWLYQVRSTERPFLPPPPVSVYQAFTVSCTVVLDRGRLESRYVATFTWREPLVLPDGPRVVVVNENPVDLEVALAAVSERAEVVWTSRVRVGALSRLAVDLPGTLGPGRYEVRAVYEFMGASRSVKVDVWIG